MRVNDNSRQDSCDIRWTIRRTEIQKLHLYLAEYRRRACKNGLVGEKRQSVKKKLAKISRFCGYWPRISPWQASAGIKRFDEWLRGFIIPRCSARNTNAHLARHSGEISCKSRQCTLIKRTTRLVRLPWQGHYSRTLCIFSLPANVRKIGFLRRYGRRVIWQALGSKWHRVAFV